MKQEQIEKILEEHKAWLNRTGGAKADLHGADLRVQTCVVQTCVVQTCVMQTCVVQTCVVQTCMVQTCVVSDITNKRPIMPCNARKKGRISDTKRQKEK